MGEWQPIESAPRDGSWMLLAGGTTEYRWDGDEPPPMVVGQYTEWLNGIKRKDGHWQYAWYDGGYLGIYESPTLWQPLPEPPTPR